MPREYTVVKTQVPVGPRGGPAGARRRRGAVGGRGGSASRRSPKERVDDRHDPVQAALVGGQLRVPTRFVQKYTARGSAGRLVRARRRTAARPAQAPSRGDLFARTAGGVSMTRALYRCTLRATAGGHAAPRGKGVSRCARRSRSRLRTVGRPVYGMRLRGVSSAGGALHLPRVRCARGLDICGGHTTTR